MTTCISHYNQVPTRVIARTNLSFSNSLLKAPSFAGSQMVKPQCSLLCVTVDCQACLKHPRNLPSPPPPPSLRGQFKCKNKGLLPSYTRARSCLVGYGGLVKNDCCIKCTCTVIKQFVYFLIISIYVILLVSPEKTTATKPEDQWSYKRSPDILA